MDKHNDPWYEYLFKVILVVPLIMLVYFLVKTILFSPTDDQVIDINIDKQAKECQGYYVPYGPYGG